MKKNQGFTLVELVIVIVILGILAVTAAPKFLNLSGDAKASTLKAVKASIESANAQVYAKAIIASKQNEATYKTVNPEINLVYGYVRANKDDLTNVLDLATSDWTIAAGVANTALGIATTDVTVQPQSSTLVDGNTAKTAACVLIYKQAASAGAKPVMTLEIEGC
jgi:MSHA pilin protein MshA